MVKIRIQFPNGSVSERTLAPGTYSIGREVGDIVLGDPNVSGRHAELAVDATGITVRDVGSTNGTFDAMGNRLAAPLRLAAVNPWVRLGASVITLVSLPAPSALVGGVGGTQVMPQQAPAQGGFMPAPAYAPQQPAPAYAPQHAQPYQPPQQPAYAPPPPPYQPPPQAAHAPDRQPSQQPAYAPLPPYQEPPRQQVAYAPQPGFASDPGGSEFSHPDQAVRHSYPIAQQAFGLGAAFGLLMRTSPFVFARLGVLFGLSVVSLIYWIIVIAGFVFLGSKSPIVGWAWLIATLVAAGWVWHTIVRYFLHLLKAAHIAVLTEVITQGQVGNGREGMFAYGKRIVTERFGEVNALFAVDMLVDGIVRAFNRTLDWISNLIPIPGLQSVVAFVKAVLRASTTYIDESIFSYNLARGDANVYRSSKDGLVYYAQNAQEILKTGIWVVILERALSFVLFWIIFAPTLALAYLLPNALGGWITVTAIVAGLLFANSVRQAFLRPLFLTMLLLRFHFLVRGQPIDLVWDQRLEAATSKFRELKDKAAQWVARPPGGRPAGQAAPAE